MNMLLVISCNKILKHTSKLKKNIEVLQEPLAKR